MEEYSTQSSDLKLSRYNSAADQLQRIGGLWRDANNHSRNHDYHKWNMDLDAIWRELSADLNPNCPEEKYFLQLVEKISALLPLTKQVAESFNKKLQYNIEKSSKEYRILMEKEVFLRRMQNKLGKGSAYKDEFEDDFE